MRNENEVYIESSQRFSVEVMARFLLLLVACLLPTWTAGALDASITTQLLWPMPSSVNVGSEVFSLDPSGFKFTPQGANAGSDILKQAIARYSDLIFKTPVPFYPSAANTSAAKDLSELTIAVSSTDEKLGLDTDETCRFVPEVVNPANY